MIISPHASLTRPNEPADVLNHVPADAYLIVPVHHRSLSQRARALIAIAHPDHRDRLRHGAHQAGLLH
jgi:hypothetical protein